VLWAAWAVGAVLTLHPPFQEMGSDSAGASVLVDKVWELKESLPSITVPVYRLVRRPHARPCRSANSLPAVGWKASSLVLILRNLHGACGI
jgi:hypothetical protein